MVNLIKISVNTSNANSESGKEVEPSSTKTSNKFLPFDSIIATPKVPLFILSWCCTFILVDFSAPSAFAGGALFDASTQPGYNPTDGTYCLNPAMSSCQRTTPAAGPIPSIPSNVDAYGNRNDQPLVLDGYSSGSSSSSDTGSGLEPYESEHHRVLREVSEKLMPKGGSPQGDSSLRSATPVGPATQSDSASPYQVNFLYPTGSPNLYPFSKTEKAQQAFDIAQQKYQNETCAMTTLDKVTAAAALGGMGSAVFGKGSDVATAGSAASLAGGAANATAMAFGQGCEEEKAVLEKQQQELLQTAANDMMTCQEAGRINATSACAPLAETPAYASCYGAGQTQNRARCGKVKTDAEIKANTTLGWIKQHAWQLGTTLAALGAGAAGLMTSGEEIRDENKTVAGANKNKKDEAVKNESKTDENGSSNNPTLNASALANQSCDGELKPLECFVTPQCSLQCVASNFGVSNYGGKEKDATRINANGTVVKDPKNQPQSSSTIASLPSTNTNSSFNSGASGSRPSTLSSNPTSSNSSDAAKSDEKEAGVNRAIASFSGIQYPVSNGIGIYDDVEYSETGAGSSNTLGTGSSVQQGGSNPALLIASKYKDAVVSGPIRQAGEGGTIFDPIRRLTGNLALSGMTIP